MFQTPKGTRDIFPEDMEKFLKIKDTFRDVFERYGFVPLETPAFENFGLLSAKGGLGEAVKDEIYYFKDKGDRELGLRFDLTMPLARFVMNNPNLPKPFKRYQIGRVWRYDNPQAMRWREFWQADVDVIGSSSMEADVECLSVAVDCLKELGFKQFSIRLNNRKLIEYILKKKNIPINQTAATFKIIDKRDKIGSENVNKELEKKEIRLKVEELEIRGTNKEILDKIEKKFGENEGLKELKEIIELSKKLKIEKYIKIDLSLVRGLDYYTGPVFEVAIESANVSCGGGGRYDKLIKNVGGPDTSAVGISFGLDRIVSVMKESKDVKERYFVVYVNDKVKSKATNILQTLRKEGLVADMDKMNRNISKQMKYASSLKYPFVVIVGEKELKKKSVTLRNMKSGKEKLVKIKDLKNLNSILKL